MNLFSKYRNLALEMNTCKDALLELKHANIIAHTFRHANTKILKRIRFLERFITKSWFNSSYSVSQCISEQIAKQKTKNVIS